MYKSVRNKYSDEMALLATLVGIVIFIIGLILFKQDVDNTLLGLQSLENDYGLNMPKEAFVLIAMAFAPSMAQIGLGLVAASNIRKFKWLAVGVLLFAAIDFVTDVLAHIIVVNTFSVMAASAITLTFFFIASELFITVGFVLVAATLPLTIHFISNVGRDIRGKPQTQRKMSQPSGKPQQNQKPPSNATQQKPPQRQKQKQQRPIVTKTRVQGAGGGEKTDRISQTQIAAILRQKYPNATNIKVNSLNDIQFESNGARKNVKLRDLVS